MTKIEIDKVAHDLEAVCAKNIEDLPVSRDLPRLARKFTLYDDDNNKFPFTPDIQKDKIENVMYQLISKISILLNNENPDASQENFDKVVNMDIHETLNQYLLQYYGRDHRVLKVLKMCNQSTVISTLYHVRQGLKERLEFKDPRPSHWFLEFQTNDNSNNNNNNSSSSSSNGNGNGSNTNFSPVVIQRRKEQVYRFSDDKTQLINLFQFEWKLQINFDSVEVNYVKSVCVGLLNTDFSTCPMDEAWKQTSKQFLEDAFANCVIDGLKLNI